MLDPVLIAALSLILIIPLIIIVAMVDSSDIKKEGNYPGSIFNLIPCSDTAMGYAGCSSILVLVVWELIFSGTERSVYAATGSGWFFDVILIIVIALIIGHVCGAPLRLITKSGRKTEAPRRQYSTWAVSSSDYRDPPPSILLWCPICRVRLEVKIGERGVCERCGYVTKIAEWPPR
jgi:hypothetical protein